MLLRLIREQDVGACTLVARTAWDLSDTRDYPFPTARVRSTFSSCVTSPNQYFCVVAERDDEIVGYKCAQAGIEPFAFGIVCFDIATFVLPKARSLVLVKAMLTVYKKWAESIGAERAYLGAMATAKDTRVTRLFNMLGFKYIGTMHVMEIDNGQGQRRRSSTVLADDRDAEAAA